MRKLVLTLAALVLAAPAWGQITGLTSSATFTCTGSIGPFPFTFPVFDVNGYQVYETLSSNGTQTPLALNTGYSSQPTNNNYINGGTIQLVDPCLAGSTLTIQRSTEETQLNVFTEYMPALYQTFQSSLDKLTMEIQDQTYLYNNATVKGIIPGSNITCTPDAFGLCTGTVTLSSTGGGGTGGNAALYAETLTLSGSTLTTTFPPLGPFILTQNGTTLIGPPSGQYSISGNVITLNTTFSSTDVFWALYLETGNVIPPFLSTTGGTISGNLNVQGIISGGAVQSVNGPSNSLANMTSAQMRAAGVVNLSGYNVGSNLGGGYLIWTNTPTAPDNCNVFSGSDDSAGANGAFVRAGAPNIPVTAENCGAYGNTLQFTTGIMNAGSPILVGNGFVPAMVGLTAAVSGAGVAGGGLIATVKSYQSPTHITLTSNALTSNPTSGGNPLPFTYYIGTDDTAAALMAQNLLKAQAAANMPNSLVYAGGKTYMINQQLPTPAGGTNGLGGDSWTITGSGQFTLLQLTDNTPIEYIRSAVGGTMRNWHLNNLTGEWLNNQPATNTSAVCVEWDPAGDAPNGSNNWTSDNVKCVNGFRGYSISAAYQAAALASPSDHRYPIWGYEIDNCRSQSTMTGALINLGGFGSSGATRTIIRNCYSQSNLATEGTYILNQGDTLTLDTDEVDGCNVAAVVIVGFTVATIHNFRTEQCNLPFSTSHLLEIDSQTVTHIDGIQFKNEHINVATNTTVCYIHAFKARLDIQNINVDTDTSMGGTAYVVCPPDGPDSSTLGYINFGPNLNMIALGHTYLYLGGPPTTTGGETHITFTHGDTFYFTSSAVPTNTNSIPFLANNPTGILRAPHDGYIVSIDIVGTLAVTAGSINPYAVVNGVPMTAGLSGTLNTSTTSGTGSYTYRTAAPIVDMFVAPAGNNFFAKGEILTVLANSSAGFAPAGTGQNISVQMNVMYLP